MKKEPIICYHFDDPDFKMRCKDLNGKYQDKWLWGNLYTNKACRTESRFAKFMASDGRKIHYFNRATFKSLAHLFEHVYNVEGWDRDFMRMFERGLSKANAMQLASIMQRIQNAPCFRSAQRHLRNAGRIDDC